MLQQYVALKSSLRIVPCNITFKVMLHDDSQRRFQALLCVALEQCWSMLRPVKTMSQPCCYAMLH